MKKVRLYLDFDKEEKWLQSMAKQGWQLQSVCFTYTFKKSLPDSEPIRMDFHIFNSTSRYQDYLALFEDSGWKHIAGYKSVGTHYFERTRPDASEDIFSDASSKAGRYKRASEMWMSMFACYTALFGSFAVNSSHTNLWNYMRHPKSAFLTPGIWEMHGSAFRIAFFFESPFAIFRVFSIPFFLLLLVFYGVCAVTYLHHYRKSMKNWDRLQNSGSRSSK